MDTYHSRLPRSDAPSFLAVTATATHILPHLFSLPLGLLRAPVPFRSYIKLATISTTTANVRLRFDRRIVRSIAPSTSSTAHHVLFWYTPLLFSLLHASQLCRYLQLLLSLLGSRNQLRLFSVVPVSASPSFFSSTTFRPSSVCTPGVSI